MQPAGHVLVGEQSGGKPVASRWCCAVTQFGTPQPAAYDMPIGLLPAWRAKRFLLRRPMDNAWPANPRVLPACTGSGFARPGPCNVASLMKMALEGGTCMDTATVNSKRQLGTPQSASIRDARHVAASTDAPLG